MNAADGRGPVDLDFAPVRYAEAIARRRAARHAGNQGAEDALTDALDDLWRAMTPEKRREAELMAELDRLRAEADFYRRRCEALQEWQGKMRDPERRIVCDILANGHTLHPAVAGDRYSVTPNAALCGHREGETR